MQRVTDKNATTHGLRASFATWPPTMASPTS
jgi:hypothetical protein